MPSLVLRPGMFIRLKQQPGDLPDFILEHYCGDTCWIRQQAWGPHICLRIKVTQIAIPDGPVSLPSAPAYWPLPALHNYPNPCETQYSKEKTYLRKRV